MSPRFIFATSNAGKAKEMAALLGGRAEILTLKDFPAIVMPEETGATFEENARQKAEHVAGITGLRCLADDSGLEVDALGGAPGVRSARYAPGSDADRMRALLAALEAVPDGARAARFRAAIALACPGRPTEVTEGRVEGSITRAPRGEHGFGYDPIFLVAGTDRTMAQLHLDKKSEISHRARAFAALLPSILREISLESGGAKP
ncbi:MAG: RdgB/HAM1 family non-canonical purine NTP pyrophosphatase [Myxococcota bacterium]